MTDLQKYLVDEYLEDYQNGRISRRQALKVLAGITGSLTMANGLLAACAPPPTATSVPPTDAPPEPAATTAPEATATSEPPPVPEGVRVPEDDRAVVAGPVEIPAGDATIAGYLARPAGDGTYPVVLVCHENRGLNPHTEDIARRLAKAGYVGLALDLLSREGGSATLSQDDIPGILGNVPPERFTGDFIAGWRYLQEQPYARSDAAAMMGFCFGGGVTWRVAAALPELAAAIPFYGSPVPAEEVPNIQAAVLAIYGGLDERINATIPEIEAAMQAEGKTYEKVIYDGANHAFFNDTRDRYAPEAAQDAWTRTLAWIEQHLPDA